MITARFGGSSCRIIVGSGVMDSLPDLELPHYDMMAAIVSSRVYKLHRERIDRVLGSMKNCRLFEMEDGEEKKSFSNAERYLERMLKEGLTRSSMVISIGGGVTGDFAGFLASVYMRGIPFIQVPTTLLAMVDASVGGKVAVNLWAGKNIIGSFHQPVAVVSDTVFIETLPERELINGLAEVVKHGLIGDLATLSLLERNSLQTLRTPGTLASIVAASAGFKASVVEKDEKEKGQRKILNFGHTIGHAIESSLGYRGFLHGEAVAAGMYIKLGIMRDASMISAGEFDRAVSLFNRSLLLRRDIGFDPEEVIRHMAYDKKNEFGETRFVLLEGIGSPVIDRTLGTEIVAKWLGRYLSETEGNPADKGLQC